MISHDRHFLNSVCTHTADIDYQTIITYTGGYDDMVLQKTQVRSRIESENAQREKKIAQLNEFIARFSAGTRASQVTSRKKEVERLQTQELARSNIQRPYIRFEQKRPSGRHALEFKNVVKGYDGLEVINGFSAAIQRGQKIALMGRNGTGKTTLLKALLANAPGVDDPDVVSIRAKWSGGTKPRSATSRRTTAPAFLTERPSKSGCTRFDPQASREEIRGLLGQMLFRGEEGTEAHRCAVGRRSGAAHFLQADAAETERSGV